MSFGLIKGLSRSFLKMAMGAANDEDAEARINALRVVVRQKSERSQNWKAKMKIKANKTARQKKLHAERLEAQAKAMADKLAQEEARKAEDLKEREQVMAELAANKAR